MEKEILVSIIIPTYKRNSSLKRAINSVLTQTYKNIEVIIVDDNNPETSYRKSTEILMGEFSGDSRVIYFKHSHNKNGAAARNTGIQMSKGEIICFLDDDDYFLPSKIERQLEVLLRDKRYRGIYCGRFQSGKEIKPKYKGDLTKEILLLEFTPTTPTLMFYKDVLIEINGFNESFKRHQDFDLLIRFFAKYEINTLDETLVVIGENEGENTLNGSELEELKENFFNSFKFTINKFPKFIQNEIYSSHYSEVFWRHLNNNNNKMAMKIFKENVLKYHFTYLKYIVKYFVMAIKVKSKSRKKIIYES